MRNLSRIKNKVGTVAKIDADFTLGDERLARRWKRRCIAHQNSSKTPKDVTKKCNRKNETDIEIVDIDSDYENFLTDMDQLVAADDVNNVDDNANCDVSLPLERSHDGDILDPQYMMFLDNLKVDGNSYVLTLTFGSGAPLVVKYEKDDNNAPRRKNKEARNRLRNNKSSNVPIIDRKVPVVDTNVELEPDNVFHCPTNDCVSDMMDESYREFLNSLKDDGQNYVYAPEGGEKVVYEKVVSDSASDMIDESYQEFLNSLEDGGRNFVYAPEGGEKVVYEKEASDSDSEVVILDANSFPDGEYDPFVGSKSHILGIDVDGEGCAGGLARSKEAQFRKKLMKIFQRPYDHKELKDLMRAVSQQRPLEERPRILRGREVNRKSRSLGKSYLELYDLARTIHEVKDQRRILNVLRGFFFWLENVSFEGGAFKPWLDAACLEVLPGE